MKKEELDFLKRKLPWGAIKRVSIKHNVSLTMVSRIFKEGISKNPKCINLIEDLIIEAEEFQTQLTLKEKDLTERLANLRKS